MTEERLRELIDGVGGAEIVEAWQAGDVRPGRSDEIWLNALIQRR